MIVPLHIYLITHRYKNKFEQLLSIVPSVREIPMLEPIKKQKKPQSWWAGKKSHGISYYCNPNRQVATTVTTKHQAVTISPLYTLYQSLDSSTQ